MAAELGHVLAVHKDLAAGSPLLPQDQLEQCRFARAAVAQQKYELAVVHMEVDVFQRGLLAVLVLLRNVFKVDHESYSR